MALTPITQKQVPDHSIMDRFDRQTYLGNAFIATTAVSLSNTNETGVILLQNPASTAAAGTTQKAIFVNLRRFSSSAQEVLIKTYVNPAVSSTSTAYAPVNLRPAINNSSISACYVNGQFSTSSNGTLLSSVGCAGDDYVVQDNLLLIILDPGQSLLITATALVSTTSVNADVSWYEL